MLLVLKLYKIMPFNYKHLNRIIQISKFIKIAKISDCILTKFEPRINDNIYCYSMYILYFIFYCPVLLLNIFFHWIVWQAFRPVLSQDQGKRIHANKVVSSSINKPNFFPFIIRPLSRSYDLDYPEFTQID